MATPRSTRNRPSLATPKFNVADVAKQATRRKPAPGYSFSETRQMAPGYGEPTPTNLTQRPSTDIVPKEPLPQLVEGKDGKMVPFDPNAEAPVRSYEDIGASLAQDEYTQNLATELDITGGQKGYTSLEEYAADQYDALKESKQLQEAKLADQQLQTSEGVTQAEKSLRSQTLSGASRLAGNREGFVSSSNQSVASKLGRLASEKMQRINSQKDLVDMEIEDARANLDRAERAGSTQIAEQYRQVLDAAEYKARQIDTEYYNALSQQAQEKRANFTVFQGLVDSGQELNTETIAGFAEQLGIPFNDAYGYYKGQQAVRDNNKLTNDEKAIELQNLAYDFDRKLRGIETEQQIAIDFLKTMREKGFSEEEISAYKQMNGITDYDDPLTQAELEYKQLENEIKRKQMAGEPTSIAEMEALFDLRQKIDAQAGTGGTAYVSPSIDGISMSYEGGGLNVTLPRNPDGTLKAYQCGEFVNRAWGIPKGGAGGFGDYMSDKMNTVDKNGFRTEGMMAEQIASMIVPGMAFVSESGETGHVGLIVSGVDAQGNFQTLEANVGDGNPNVPDPPIYKTQNVKDQNIKGFAYPPNGAAVGGQGDYFTSSLANSAGGAKVPVEQLNALVKSFDSVNQVQYLTELFNKDKTVGLDGSKIDLSPITGWLQSKNPWDADAQTINSILTGTVPTVARGIFGEVGVLTDADVALYKQVLPNLTQTDEVKALVSAALLRTVKNGLQNRLEILANSGYDVSGLAPKYNMLVSQIAQIEGELGIQNSQTAQQVDPQQAEIEEDVQILRNGGMTDKEAKKQFWDALSDEFMDFINNLST